jgi:uncharacterized protein (DUF2147 family)
MRIDIRLPVPFATSLALTVALLFAGAIGAARAEGDPAGIWLTQAGDAKVQVSRCGGTLCGKVVWLRTPIDSATGRPQADDKNQNPALRTRPIIGIQLFIDMRPSASNAWSGRIYNADDGKSYSSTVTQIDAGRLEVRGCVGALCGSETWTRTTR